MLNVKSVSSPENKRTGRSPVPRLFGTLIAGVLTLANALAQTAPPTLQSVTPSGAQRGTKVALILDGTNIGGATELIFSEPGFSARIVDIEEVPLRRVRNPRDTGAPIDDKARKYVIKAELTVSPAAPPGVHSFRLHTPLGVSNLAVFAVGLLPEVPEVGFSSLAEPQKISLPATISGSLDDPGDVDAYRFAGRPGELFVFRTVARAMGSGADTILRLYDSKNQVVAENNDFESSRDALVAYRFADAGMYTLTVEDVEPAGGGRYRIEAGVFPLLTEAFPLGVQKDSVAKLEVKGLNLGKTQTVEVAGLQSALRGKTIPIVAQTAKGPSVNRLRVHLGDYPEVAESEPNGEIAVAQMTPLPVTINGRIFSGTEEQGPDRDLYRFRSRKGDKLVFEVHAQRLGSPLDSILEIVTPDGRPVPRATLRCVAQTTITLNDPDAGRRGMRLTSWTDFAINDYVLIGEELLQVQAMPTHPDNDLEFKGFRGPRIGFLDTTPGNYAVNTPVYKVEVHPPGTKFAPNGMPLFQINYRNDDGGPKFGNKDSRLHFTAPADGDYIVRVRDVRDMDGERFAYRLTIRPSTPDFEVTYDPKVINIQRGGRVSLIVTATRRDEFDGPIEVELRDLPEGLSATRGVIPAGADTTVILVSARADASLANSSVALEASFLESTSAKGAPAAMTVAGLAPIKLVAKAHIDGRELVRAADPEEPISVIALAPKPDLVVTADVDRVELTAGKSATLTVRVERQNGFAGRVPLAVLNLPHGVKVDDIGLNGIMITEQETSRTFHLVAEPWVQPTTQPLFAVGRVEVISPLRNESAAAPVMLVVKAAATAPGQPTPGRER